VRLADHSWGNPVSARSTALVGIAALTVLAGCASAPSHKGATGAASNTASPVVAPTKATISAIVAQLGPEIEGAVRAAPRVRGTEVEALSTFTDIGTICPTGSVQDDIVAGLVLPNSGVGPNPAPAARAYLDNRGWHFGPWAVEAPRPSTGGDQTAKASGDGVTLVVTYTLTTFQVAAMLPCLPGKVIPMG